MIYAVQRTVGAPIKIGFSNDIARRFAALQTASPWPLTLLGQCQGTVFHEKWIHAELRLSNLRGEWFAAVPRVLDLLDKIFSPDWVWPVSKNEPRFRSIIGVWPSPDVMAADIGAKAEAVRKWRQRDSIPAEWWVAVVDAAAVRGHVITADQLAILAARDTPKAKGEVTAFTG